MKVVCDGSPVIHRVYRKEKDWSVVDCLNDACGGILYHLSNRHTEELKDNPNPYPDPYPNAATANYANFSQSTKGEGCTPASWLDQPDRCALTENCVPKG